MKRDMQTTRPCIQRLRTDRRLTDKQALAYATDHRTRTSFPFVSSELRIMGILSNAWGFRP